MIRSILKITIALLLLSVLANSFDLLEQNDSRTYKKIAFSITDAIERTDFSKLEFGIRTPVFPIFLALANALPFHFGFSVMLLHGVLALIAMVMLANAIEPFIKKRWSYVAIAFYFYTLKFYYSQCLTEWLSFCLLLMLLALLLRAINETKISQIFTSGLLCSIAVLTRPSLLVMYIVPLTIFVLCLVRLPNSFWKALLLGIGSNLLIAAWGLFNFYKIGDFCLFPFSSLNLFGVAAILGEADVEANDPAKLKEFILEVNKTKKSLGKDEKEMEQFFKSSSWPYAFNHNLYAVGYNLSKRIGLQSSEMFSYMKIYSERSLSKNRARHFYYWRQSMSRYLHSLVEICLSLIIFCLAKSIGKLKPLSYCIIIAFAIHYLHASLCSMVEVAQYRYIIMTYNYPLLVSGLVLLAIFQFYLIRNKFVIPDKIS